eukprot:CAMPEP_0203790206 /NCGR_PEP_ID=MMETSP0100_2-20121128/3912_1 /ASSEMBLY_ACC=CAM_ASM_000210 /TAXON_ID=96639 /ORGANISM=" , Strain NY0313808BC1" /LENGTH=549 /DNA_ID=CAMNT_0050693311 /DNA_START=179 /DNA_END=1828 /DNA_ORIENTATION=-
MEWAVNVPMKDWYLAAGEEPLNPGLCSPPLGSYMSWLFGSIARYLVPKLVEPGSASIGYEDDDARGYMRATVLVCDIVLFFLATWCFVIIYYRSNVKVSYAEPDELRDTMGRFLLYSRRATPLQAKKQTKRRVTGANRASSFSSTALSVPVTLVSEVFLIILLQPGLILIDHGHFHYSAIYLGLVIWAFVMCLQGHHFFATVAFCLAVNFDQVSLFYAPAVFLFMASGSMHSASLSSSSRWTTFTVIIRITKILLAICLTFGVLWAPFCFLHGFTNDDSPSFHMGRCASSLIQTFNALILPIQLPVPLCANIWSVLFGLVGFETIEKVPFQVVSCICTMLALGPSCIDIIRRGRAISVRRLLWGVFNSSLTFFLVFYNVQAKVALLPLLPAALLCGEVPGPSCWFSVLVVFSLSPLLVYDKLAVPYVVTTSIFTATNAICFRGECCFLPLPWVHRGKADSSLVGIRHGIRMIDFSFYLKAAALVAISLHFGAFFLPTPWWSPNLWVRLHYIYSCILFCLAWMYGNWYQWMLPVDEVGPGTQVVIKPKSD